jgi:hypothetical protein
MSWLGKHTHVEKLKVGDCFLTRSNNVLQVIAVDVASYKAKSDNMLSLTLQNKMSSKTRTSDWWKTTAVFLIEKDGE